MGSNSFAIGKNTTACGDVSFALGTDTEACGANSVSEGLGSSAKGNNSHSEGNFSQANGSASHSQNFYTIAQNDYQTVIGKYNVASSSSLNGSQDDDAFIIGNGNSEVRSNAFRVQFNGNAHIAGTFNLGGADYAEMFEWADGNPENEDRRGYFVAAQQGYIRKANETDSYLIGAISSSPAMTGDSQSSEWKGKYLRDEWGEVQYETISEQREISEINSKTGKTEIHTEVVQVKRPKLNEAYDPNKKFLPRAERKEWAAVGLIGKLIVRDDGSCEVGGFCRSNADGIATAGQHGYLVLKRINDEKILILLDGSKSV
jgi:hypothetical protein